MKIRSITFINSPVFGNAVFDFRGKDGRAIDTIIIAGENGCGKTLLLDMIYRASLLNSEAMAEGEEREFDIELSDEEYSLFSKGDQIINHIPLNFSPSNVSVKLHMGGGSTYPDYAMVSDGTKGFNLPGYVISYGRELLKTLYSDVEINFLPSEIQSITTGDIDRPINSSTKAGPNLATQIAQLLVDIQSLDALEFSEWARKHPGTTIDNEKLDVRMRRFASAFNFMFDSKRYKTVTNRNGSKAIIFEENGRESTLAQLSSGEKQVVFRGSFLLKDKLATQGALALIDEPEISMHPNWQLRILGYFKRLLSNEQGIQTSQLIIATHSPFIIHNTDRANDKVIILYKDENGISKIKAEPDFYSWTPEKIVNEAFNIMPLVDSTATTVFLEGETDELYFNKAQQLLGHHSTLAFKWIGRINDKGKSENSGDTALNQARNFMLANPQFVTSNIILLYDSDTRKPEENHGKLEIKSMSSNLLNTTFRIGIENLLTLSDEIELDAFYVTRVKIDDYNAKSTICELDKRKLCDFICNDLSEDAQRKVFKLVFAEIQKLLKAPMPSENSDLISLAAPVKEQQLN